MGKPGQYTTRNSHNNAMEPENEETVVEVCKH